MSSLFLFVSRLILNGLLQGFLGYTDCVHEVPHPHDPWAPGFCESQATIMFLLLIWIALKKSIYFTYLSKSACGPLCSHLFFQSFNKYVLTQ